MFNPLSVCRNGETSERAAHAAQTGGRVDSPFFSACSVSQTQTQSESRPGLAGTISWHLSRHLQHTLSDGHTGCAALSAPSVIFFFYCVRAISTVRQPSLTWQCGGLPEMLRVLHTLGPLPHPSAQTGLTQRDRGGERACSRPGWQMLLWTRRC